MRISDGARHRFEISTQAIVLSQSKGVRSPQVFCSAISISRQKNDGSEFANNRVRFLVIAQSSKICVAEEPVICPFGKIYLRDQHRLEPAQFAHLMVGDALA